VLRLKHLELIFSANDPIQASFLVNFFFAAHIFNFHFWKAQIDHGNVMSLQLEAPRQCDIGRNIWALIGGPMMMELSFVLHDNRKTEIISPFLIN
jgi:hypothetical protein